MSRPPVRWADTQLPESLSNLLKSAQPTRADDAAALARMRARLSQSLGPSFETQTPGAPSGSGSKLWRSVRWKWLAGGALVVSGLSLFGTQAARIPEPEAEVPRAATSGVEQPAPEPAADSGSAEPLQAQPLENEPAAEAVAKRAASRPARPRTQETKQPGLAEELRGIEQIRKLLSTSPTQALVAAEEQQHRFSGGALAPERELLRVEALVRAGRVEEARARAKSSKQYREQLEKLLE